MVFPHCVYGQKIREGENFEKKKRKRQLFIRFSSAHWSGLTTANSHFFSIIFSRTFFILFHASCTFCAYMRIFHILSIFFSLFTLPRARLLFDQSSPLNRPLWPPTSYSVLYRIFFLFSFFVSFNFYFHPHYYYPTVFSSHIFRDHKCFRKTRARLHYTVFIGYSLKYNEHPLFLSNFFLT